VVKAVAPTVVQIQTPAGLGSGVVLDHEGDVITNAHIVGRFHTFAITPTGLRSSVTQGMVSSVGRTIRRPTE
jgi:putative serine protease PepD